MTSNIEEATPFSSGCQACTHLERLKKEQPELVYEAEKARRNVWVIKISDERTGDVWYF